MKKIYLLFLVAAFALSSCIKDDSTYGDPSMGITISGLEQTYMVTSFNNEVLKIEPQVVSSFDASDMEYEWTYYDPRQINMSRNGVTQEVIPSKIGSEKNLAYPVSLADGSYVFIFTARSKSTGYSQQLSTTVYVSSVLSQGFVILKETADGNTDYDIFNTVRQQTYANVIAEHQGKAVPGKPVSVDISYGQPYLNEETQAGDLTNTINIITDKNLVRWIRSMDCKTVKDETTCHYEPVAGEVPYRTVQGYFDGYLVTNKGVYSAYYGRDARGADGTTGESRGNGGSTHVVSSIEARGGIVYWDDNTHSMAFNGINNAYAEVGSEVEGYPTTNTNYDCLFAGVSTVDQERVFFLLQDRTDPSKKVIYIVDSSSKMPSMVKVVKVDPNSHLAHATEYAANGLQATIAYGVDNNVVYSFDFMGVNPEKKLAFQGLPAGEKITYLSNRFLKGSDAFDYLIVGTQTGNSYKLYMYRMVGGEPVGNPVHTVSGTGKLKGVNYLSNTLTSREVYPSVTAIDH